MSSQVVVTGGTTKGLQNLLNTFFTRKTGVQVLTDAATIAFDTSLGVNASVALTTSRIIGNPTNAQPGDSGHLTIIQPVAGSALATWGSAWRHAGGTDFVLSTEGGTIDTIYWYTPDGIVFEILSAPLPAPEGGGLITVANALARYGLSGVEVGDIVHQTDNNTDYEWLGVSSTIVGCVVGPNGTIGWDSHFTDRGTLNGKRRYQTGGFDDSATISAVYWDGDEWLITDNQGDRIYASSDAVAFPWLVTTWTVGVAGNAPVPEVTTLLDGDVDAGVTVSGIEINFAGSNGFYTSRGFQTFNYVNYNLLGSPDSAIDRAIRNGGFSYDIVHDGSALYQGSTANVNYPWETAYTADSAAPPSPTVTRNDYINENNWSATPL